MEQQNCNGQRRKGKHVTQGERVVIETMLGAGIPAPSIATALGRHRRTIERERVRGQVQHWDPDWRQHPAYSSDRGQAVHDRNATAKGPELKLGRNQELVEFVRVRIVEHRESPAVVAHRMRVGGLEGAVCAKTLYTYIEAGFIAGVSNESLWEKRQRRQRTRHTLRRPRRTPTRRQSIEQRPLAVNAREEFGHWEIDLVVGPIGSRGTIMTLIERKTRKTIIRKLKDKTHRAVRRALDALEREYGTLRFRCQFLSITADNGSEFLDVDGMQNSAFSQQRRTALFYAHPYASWERGTNENTNRMIRRFIPKQQFIEHLTRRTIAIIENWLNNYPRQIIDFDSPNQRYEQEIIKLAA
jgi:transposase, IS30 family